MENFGQPVILASISVLASVLTASLSYYFTKKNQLKAEERRLKEEFYRIFIKALSDLAIDNTDHQASKNLSESINSLLLIASSDVVRELMNFHNFVKSSNNSISRDSEEWSIKHDELLRGLIKLMREDLYGINEKDFPEIHLVGAPLKKNR